MPKSILVGKTQVMEGTRTYELLQSKDPDDRKKARLLMDYTHRCYAAGYEYEVVQALRQEYAEVL